MVTPVDVHSVLIEWNPWGKGSFVPSGNCYLFTSNPATSQASLLQVTCYMYTSKLAQSIRV